MRAITATIIHNEPLIGRLVRLTLASQELATAQPGQWAALRRPDALSVLAYPFPLSAFDRRERTVDLLYENDHPLSDWLQHLPPGVALDLLAPWGRPIPIDGRARHAVLIGSGVRLMGLFALASTLIESGAAVVVLHDASTATEALPPVLLPAAAEYHLATTDGSAGEQGAALDLLPPILPWADVLYAALRHDDYPALRDLVHRYRLRARRGFATVLAEAPLACYAGACDGCAVPLRDDTYGLLCKDGPAFDLLRLV